MEELITPKCITHYSDGRPADWWDWAFGSKVMNDDQWAVFNGYVNGKYDMYPLIIHTIGEKTYLIDGWHRLVSSIKLGHNLIYAIDVSKNKVRLDEGAALKPYIEDNELWIHSDVQRLEHIEMVRSITETSPFFDNSIDEIRCCKALDHVPHNLGYSNDVSTITHIKILKEWYRILKDGGKCSVVLQYTPGICAAHVSGNLEHYDFIRMIHGVQNLDWNYKYMPMDERLGKYIFECAGFNNVLASNYYYDNERIDVDSLHIVITGYKNAPVRDK